MDTKFKKLILNSTKETTVFNPIKELQRRLPITDGGILVDEFGEYEELATTLGLELTEFRGKLAYKIIGEETKRKMNDSKVDSKETDELK